MSDNINNNDSNGSGGVEITGTSTSENPGDYIILAFDKNNDLTKSITSDDVNNYKNIVKNNKQNQSDIVDAQITNGNNPIFIVLSIGGDNASVLTNVTEEMIQKFYGNENIDNQTTFLLNKISNNTTTTNNQIGGNTRKRFIKNKTTRKKNRQNKRI